MTMLTWELEVDGDYLHYRSQILMGGEDYPFYWCGCNFVSDVDPDANPDDETPGYGLRLVGYDDDEVIINGEVAPVPLADAQAAAERHFAMLLRRINDRIPGTPESLRHINNMILGARESGG
jgi:hypothetical protein